MINQKSSYFNLPTSKYSNLLTATVLNLRSCSNQPIKASRKIMKLVRVAIFLTLCVKTHCEMRMKVKSFKCTASTYSVAPNFTCFAKSYSRKYSTINFNIYFTRTSVKTMVSKVLTVGH